MHSLTCAVRDFNAASDTCTVEVQGIGIVDVWIDGVAIAPTVDRSFIVAGAPGVITLPDINRPCDATLIQVTPPGSPVSYDPDQIVTYTGSILVTTDTTGAGCQDVVFPTPYASVPVISASAAHPASVTISNATESGFTACVTGGRVSSRHAVSYSAKSTKTSTATKNKAPTVDHNETDVATHYIIDFKDGDVQWIVSDKASPARAQIEATLSPAYLASLGAAGGSPHHLLLHAATSGDSRSTGNWLGDAYQGIGGGTTDIHVSSIVYVDTVDADTDSFWNPSTQLITIPTGLAGLYLVAASIEWQLIQQISHAGTYTISIDDFAAGRDECAEVLGASTMDSGGNITDGASEGTLAYSRVVSLEEGDQLVPHFSASADWALASANARFALVRLASAATTIGSSTTLGLTADDSTNNSGATSQPAAYVWPGPISDNTGGKIWSSAHPTRLTAPTDGVYLLTATVTKSWPGAVAIPGESGLWIYKNGSTTPLITAQDQYPNENTTSSPYETTASLALPISLLAGDFLEVTFPTSGPDTLKATGTFFSLTNINGGMGPPGPRGPAGTDGTDGTDGVGVPAGGTSGQVLAKASATDFDTHWIPDTATGSTVTSLNTETGDLTIVAGTGISVSAAGTSITITNTEPGSAGVSALNSLTGALSIAAGSGISVSASGSTITVTNTASSYTLPDATTTSTGGTEIDYPPAGAHPIALTQNSQGKIHTAELPTGSVDVDPTLAQGDLLVRRTATIAVIGYIGDSITLDTPSGGNPPPTNVSSDLTAGSLTVSATNQALDGTTSSEWTPTAGTGYEPTAKAAFLAAGVKIVHIMLGTNDCKNTTATSQAAYKSNLAAICADLNAAGIICVLSYPPYAVPGSSSGQIDSTSLTLLLSYQTAIDQLVNGTTIRQGDVSAYSYFSAHTSELSDGVHPTAAGSLDLASLWASALSPIVTAPLARLPIGVSGQVLTSNGSDPYWATPAAAGSGTELLTTDGITNPPESLWTDDGTDWIYADA